MESKTTVNIWVGPPLGADSCSRFEWQCKTLAAWTVTSEDSVKAILFDLLERAATSLHTRFMKISAKRFGKHDHPNLFVEQMYDALYPVLVQVIDIVAALNPPMTVEREPANAARLFNTIKRGFLYEANQLPSKFETLLANTGFFEAFTELCKSLENIVKESNDFSMRIQSN